MKIMIVDDEKLALEKITEQINSFDFVSEIRALDNPIHALNSLKHSPVDIAILDIEMFGMNGLELAKQCKCIQPNIKIIFLTGYSHYAVKAFKLRVNGYLLKPASTEEIKEELLEIFDLIPATKKDQIRIQTFGNFELFINEQPVVFERAKAKELLAYLISKKGAFVSGNELLAVLYEDKPITTSAKSQLRNIIASMTKTLKAVDASHLILKRRNQLAIDPSACSCDYYDFLQGDIDSINSFMGEFMSNYEWAEFITGYLENSRQDKIHG